MCAISQPVSAPLNPIPTVDRFRRSHPQCEHSYCHYLLVRKNSENKAVKAIANRTRQLNKGCWGLRINQTKSELLWVIIHASEERYSLKLEITKEPIYALGVQFSLLW